jgi:hypothetical protein
METMPPLLFVSVSAENYQFQMATAVNYAFLCLFLLNFGVLHLNFARIQGILLSLGF